jgi:hypothetical protein
MNNLSAYNNAAFKRIFGNSGSAYTDDCNCLSHRQPERPIDPPATEEASLELAVKSLKASLQERTKSEHWDDLVAHVLDELDGPVMDEILKAVMEEEGLVLLSLMKDVLGQAIIWLANENLDLGRIA